MNLPTEFDESRLDETTRILFQHGADEDAKNLLKLRQKFKEQAADLAFEKDQAAIMRSQLEGYEEVNEFSLEAIEKVVEQRYAKNFVIFSGIALVLGGVIGYGIKSVL